MARDRVEIQRVIDHFTENHFTDDSEDVEQDNEVLEEPDQINVLEILPPKESTAPIPLAHIFNSSDDFKESVKETNEEVVSQSVKTDDDSNCNRNSDSEEEMPDDSDDDGYNGYGGYNEYDECDRGYYYRDGRYERRGSPMMSPIISPNMSSSDKSSSLTNLRIFAYNVLKSLEDKAVGDNEFPELRKCTECGNEILSFPFKALTLLGCGHAFHRLCIEKKLLHAETGAYPGATVSSDTTPLSKIKEKKGLYRESAREVEGDRTFFELYLKISNAEERNENARHELIIAYYLLGEELEKRLVRYRKRMKTTRPQRKSTMKLKISFPKRFPRMLSERSRKVEEGL
ncbi:hypothetical protein RhiirA1_442963 [Rhizophagus irregularis]|uniref:RING-type domain-containing protein n=3 Tax=Rhizophagus irregularis TaxID=588596 RepID=A0A2N0RLL8_9GLOM|nr:hypothetical protein RhiirA1_442963 [Rhizophagus irregularis]